MRAWGGGSVGRRWWWFLNLALLLATATAKGDVYDLYTSPLATAFTRTQPWAPAFVVVARGPSRPQGTAAVFHAPSTRTTRIAAAAAAAGPSDADADADAARPGGGGHFDVAAAIAAAAGAADAVDPVRAVLRAAGVSDERVDRAYKAFPGLAACHPREEVVRRLEHLDFLVKIEVYTKAQAEELVATQPRFLEMRFGVVHEDADLFVMEKPPDTRMDVPAREGEGGERKWPTEYTCADWLDSGVVDPPLEKKRFAHNLDSGTSGILVLSKNRETAARCNELFAGRRVEKEYLALVFGHVAQDSLFIDAPIEKDPTSGFCMRVAQGGGGKKAQTQVEVLERGHFTVQGPHWNAPVTKLRLKPITGRRHQLRVHTASIGHPMVGDAAYAGDWATYRLFLHAHRLRLPLAPPERDLWLSTADPFLDALSPTPLID